MAISQAPREEIEVSWTTLVCLACQRPTFILETTDLLRKLWSFVPAQGHERVSTTGVPEVVVADYGEAIGCLQVGAHKAAAAMARRAVQGMCVSLLGRLDADALRRAELTKEKIEKLKKGTLFQQVEALWKAGELTNRLQVLASQVRVFGNYGAHPGDDLLESVSEPEARKAIAFLEHLLQHVFVLGEEA